MKHYFIVSAFLMFTIHIPTFANATEAPLSDKTLKIVLNVNPSIRPSFIPIFRQFYDETGIRIIPQQFVEDYNFEKNMERWLVEGVDTPDVLYGHNNMRLQKMAELGVIHNISDLWLKHDWYSSFREELIEGSSYANEQYGIPYSMYTWGLFYHKSLTDKLGPVPQDWKAFKTFCRKLKGLGVSPFPASQKQPYIAAAWFEYLMLRMHGLALFSQVMTGQLSFTNVKIQEVLVEWKSLIDEGFFDTKYYDMRWEQYLPYFLRKKIGFVLMGSPLGSRIFDDSLKRQIEFMPFPKIRKIAKYETAPSNVFFIAQNSSKKIYAEQFIEFISQTHIQNKLTNLLQTSPANLNATVGKDKYALQGHASIQDAKGLSPFFDRGAEPKFERLAVVSFAKFLKTGDVEALTNELESARLLSYFGNSYSYILSNE